MLRRKLLQGLATVFVSLSTFAAVTTAQTSPQVFESIKIENFGQMDEKYYRGSQPSRDDYRSLAVLGVKTVIDLRSEPMSYEKANAEAAGLKYVNIPMSAWRTPRDEDMAAFLKLVGDPETGTVFVHCKQGRHRTGVAGAIYRMSKYGWNYEKAYQEMKNYGFYTGLFHSSLKRYVHEFAVKNDLAEPTKAATVTVAPATIAN
ncbi:MAG: tyrosine-protein phosphatase [Acidobacteriota bacterium]